MKKDVFEPFSKKGNMLETTPSEQAWSRLEQKLDRHIEIRRKKRREIFNLNVYWIAAAVIGLLAITSISVFIVKNQQDHTLANLTQPRNTAEVGPQKDATAGTSATATPEVAALNPVTEDHAVKPKAKSTSDKATAITSTITEATDNQQLPPTTGTSDADQRVIALTEHTMKEAARADAEQPRSSPASGKLPVNNPLKAAKEDATKSTIAPSLVGTWLDITGNEVLEITERSVLYEGKNVIQTTQSYAEGLTFVTDEVSCRIKVLRAINLELTISNLKSGMVQKKLLHRK